MSASLHITEELEYGLKLQLRTHTSVLYLWTDIDSVTTTTINWKELYILEETILSHVLVKHIFCIYNQTYIICYVSSISAFMLRHTVKILQHPHPCTYIHNQGPQHRFEVAGSEEGGGIHQGSEQCSVVVKLPPVAVR